MPDYRYSPILSTDACNGPALFLRADSLGDNYAFSAMTNEQTETALRYDWLVAYRLASRIGTSDPGVERFVKIRPLMQSALSVLRDQCLDKYQSHYHSRCVSALRNTPELQPSGMQPPLLVRLKTCEAATDLAAVLEDIKANIATHLAWRAEVVRRELMFSHWLFAACNTLLLLPDCFRTVPDSVVFLMVKEARAIVDEHLIVGGRFPSARQLLSYSIWHGYCGKDMMLAAIDTALSEWIVETNEYKYIQKVTPR